MDVHGRYAKCVIRLTGFSPALFDRMIHGILTVLFFLKLKTTDRNVPVGKAPTLSANRKFVSTWITKRMYYFCTCCGRQHSLTVENGVIFRVCFFGSGYRYPENPSSDRFATVRTCAFMSQHVPHSFVSHSRSTLINFYRPSTLYAIHARLAGIRIWCPWWTDGIHVRRL